MQRVNGVETHNCTKYREYHITVASWIDAHGFRVIKHRDVDPDEIKHGSVPVL